jgi:hypothetical protein
VGDAPDDIAQPQGDALGAVAPVLGVGNGPNEDPHGVAEQSGRHHEEHRPPVGGLKQSAERAVGIGGAAAPADGDLGGEDADGGVQDRLGPVAHPGHAHDPGSHLGGRVHSL